MKHRAELVKLKSLGGKGRPVIKAGPFGSSITKATYTASGYKVYGQEQVVAGDASIGDYYISSELFHRLKTCEVQPGDLLISVMGTVGRVLVIPDGHEPGIINPRLLRLALDKAKVCPYYMKYFLESEETERTLSRWSQGGTMGGLNAEIVGNLKVFVPDISDQARIVELISTWDRAIDLTEQLLTEKRQRRKWLMQQLLTGKRRLLGFNASFKTVKFKDIVTPVQRQVPRPTQPYDALGIRCHCKGTFAKQVEDPEKVDMDMLFIAKAGDLIVNITFAWEGAIAIVPPEHDGRLVSHRFPTYRPNEQVVATEYLRYLITQEKFRYLLADISPGGAGRNRVMSKKDFLKLQVSIPDLAEQQKIAGILDTASCEIDLLQTKVNALSEQKKGLMQQLLTGKKRVKV